MGAKVYGAFARFGCTPGQVPGDGRGDAFAGAPVPERRLLLTGERRLERRVGRAHDRVGVDADEGVGPALDRDRPLGVLADLSDLPD